MIKTRRLVALYLIITQLAGFIASACLGIYVCIVGLVVAGYSSESKYVVKIFTASIIDIAALIIFFLSIIFFSLRYWRRERYVLSIFIASFFWIEFLITFILLYKMGLFTDTAVNFGL